MQRIWLTFPRMECYSRFSKKDNLIYKVKVHSKTNEGKSVCYYESLRAKLKNINEADDPASLAN